jgi:hypothetical protein
MIFRLQLLANWLISLSILTTLFLWGKIQDLIRRQHHNTSI